MELVPIQPINNDIQPINNAILSVSNDKIAVYKDLLAKVIPFTKSVNVLEKRAAYDLNILLKCGINKSNNTVITYLSDALDHLIQHFIPDLNILINNQVNLDDYNNQGYALLHDLVVVIMRTVMHKKKVEEFRQFCLQI
jgi:hypothetical protein